MRLFKFSDVFINHKFTSSCFFYSLRFLIFPSIHLQKRWVQKEEQVREEMKKARLGPGTTDFGAIQGIKIHVCRYSLDKTWKIKNLYTKELPMKLSTFCTFHSFWSGERAGKTDFYKFSCIWNTHKRSR